MVSLTIPRNGMSSNGLPLERSLARQLLDWHGTVEARELSPRADIVENKDHIVVRLEMPGLNIEDIDVSLDKDVLTIKAERNAPEGSQGDLYHRSELAYGTFTRAFTLPANVQRDGIDAAYVNGMLTVTLPKSEDSKPRSIEVKAS